MGSSGIMQARDMESGKLPRRFLNQTTVDGDVFEWMGDSGWILPREVVNHPTAREQGGYVYVHIVDVINSEPLQPGRAVQYRTFSDARCVGAAEVASIS